MQPLHQLLWLSAGCLLLCMAFDGTFADLVAVLRWVGNRTVTVLDRIIAAGFSITAPRRKQDFPASKVAWGLVKSGLRLLGLGRIPGATEITSRSTGTEARSRWSAGGWERW